MGIVARWTMIYFCYYLIDSISQPLLDLKRSGLMGLRMFILLMTVSVSVTGCLEKEEGCLDPNALNLDVTADVNANCNYPSIRFNVSHRWKSPPDQLDSTFVFRLNQAFEVPSTSDSVVFSSIRFYLSNITLGSSDPLRVTDSVRLTDGQFIDDDLLLLSAANFQFATGDINRFGTFSGLEFDVGFEAAWVDIDTSYLQNKNLSHVWFNETMTNNSEDRYVCQMAYTVYAANGMDSLARVVGIEGPALQKISKTGDFNVYQANHADLRLLLDYRMLLEDVDLRQTDSIAMLERILQNFDAAIEVSL